MDGLGETVARHTLLLLDGAQGWADSARAAAASLPGVSLTQASSAEDVVRRLAAGGSHFTHVLVEPDRAGAWLPVLTDLASGEPGSGTALVLLGERATPPSRASLAHTRFVSSAAGDWLADLLASPDPEETHDTLTTDELRDALANARIGARYQPIVRTADRQPLSLEVLARLDHPTRGTLSPDRFVPQMEHAGLAWPLTEMVVRRAFADWGDGRLARSGLRLALNFPLDVLLIPSALTWLERHRAMSGIPAASLTIELTESQPVSELAHLAEATARLRALGYWLAIDDVGPDIRDHRALLDLPFTALKLDKNLVRRSAWSNPAREFLVRTVISARRTGLQIVAEGIQDTATWDDMAWLGVDHAQGFLVGRPLPAEAVGLWLADWRERYPLADQTAR